MSSYNKAIIMGGVVRDPEFKQLSENSKVCKMTFAVSEKWKDKSGQDKESVCYIDVVTWGKLAELCAKYLTKGSQALVEGRLQLEQWETTDGGKRSKISINASAVQFLSKPKDASPASPAPEQAEMDGLGEDSKLPF